MKGADGYSDSDEDQHDAYLERMKEEGKIREEGDGSDDSEGDSGTDTPQLKHNANEIYRALCFFFVFLLKGSRTAFLHFYAL